MEDLLGEEFTKELAMFELALCNKIFSQDTYVDHLEGVMKDQLTGQNEVFNGGSDTRQKFDDQMHEGYVPQHHMNNYYSNNINDSYNFKFLNLFGNVNGLIRENEQTLEELDRMKGRINTLENENSSLKSMVNTMQSQVNQLMQAHNAKVDYMQAMDMRIY